MQAGGESAPINRHLSLLHFYGFKDSSEAAPQTQDTRLEDTREENLT